MKYKPQSNKRQFQTVAAQVAHLPVPDESAIKHSERLIDHIRQAMDANGGHISFATFMELALLAPGLGYYSAGSRKFGEQGDFITAPELSPLFSRCLARQSQQVIQLLRQQQLHQVDVLEFGAGSGIMAADILSELEELQSLPDRYFILEPSADLQQRQADTLAKRVPQLTSRVKWLSELPESAFIGVVLANEVVDAMPVQRLRIKKDTIEACHVAWDDGRFIWHYQPIADQEVQRRAKQIQAQLGLSDGQEYITEINMAAEGWVKAVAEYLTHGAIFIIDYGFPEHEYYHRQRHNGTLMCHYRHRSHDDPFVFPGLQDITAHVNFTKLAEAALAADLSVSGYCNQAQFLLACGLSELLLTTGHVDSIDYMQAAQQVKTLTSPEQMGELFKILALTRNIDEPLLGFGFRDQRHYL